MLTILTNDCEMYKHYIDVSERMENILFKQDQIYKMNA